MCGGVTKCPLLMLYSDLGGGGGGGNKMSFVDVVQ